MPRFRKTRMTSSCFNHKSAIHDSQEKQVFSPHVVCLRDQKRSLKISFAVWPFLQCSFITSIILSNGFLINHTDYGKINAKTNGKNCAIREGLYLNVTPWVFFQSFQRLVSGNPLLEIHGQLIIASEYSLFERKLIRSCLTLQLQLFSPKISRSD